MKNILGKNILKEKSGSALALTMFILAGMLMVAMSGSSIILLGIKAGGIQSQSTKAYFAAESGTERILWELNGNDSGLPASYSLTDPVFDVTMPGGENYKIYYSHFDPIIFTSVGEFNKTKRSVQIRM